MKQSHTEKGSLSEKKRNALTFAQLKENKLILTDHTSLITHHTSLITHH
jgi:hypothetical protein